MKVTCMTTRAPLQNKQLPPHTGAQAKSNALRHRCIDERWALRRRCRALQVSMAKKIITWVEGLKVRVLFVAAYRQASLTDVIVTCNRVCRG